MHVNEEHELGKKSFLCFRQNRSSEAKRQIMQRAGIYLESTYITQSLTSHLLELMIFFFFSLNQMAPP